MDTRWSTTMALRARPFPSPRMPMRPANAAWRSSTTPGLGTVSLRHGRTELWRMFAEDIAALLAHLGHGDFVTLGWSGAGPHSLACAARLPGRCRAAATGAGVAPFLADDLDFLAGMGPENHEEFDAALEGRQALE